MFLLFGCADGKVAPVSGTVKLDGKPLKGALVTYTPQEGGRPSFGETNEEGYYELTYTREQQGAEIGKHDVSITTFREGGGYGGGAEGAKETVPSKYNSSTELVKDVPSGGATIDFELDSDGQIDSTGGYGGGGGYSGDSY